MEIAYLGGGCFWCLEAVFDDLIGVTSVESGYMGGHTPNPTYRDVCDGVTGHAEIVRVTFDPAVLSFRELLEVFFTIHDPTTPNRQGNDVGTQYRSVIFHDNDGQRAAAAEMLPWASDLWGARAVTELAPAAEFYLAEDYHQEYFERNPNQPYCLFVVAEKVANFRQKFAHRRKSAVARAT